MKKTFTYLSFIIFLGWFPLLFAGEIYVSLQGNDKNPWGIILGPFLGAVIGELLGNKEFSQALKSGVGSLLGFIFGTLLKFVVCGYFCYQFIIGLIR